MTVYFKNNKILNTFDNKEIQDPAVLIDYDAELPRNTIFLKYGEKLDILKEYNQMTQTYNKAGFEGLAKRISVISFKTKDGALTLEEITYVLKRMIEYTATNFINEFLYHMKHDTTTAWLKSEMETVPINIEKNR